MFMKLFHFDQPEFRRVGEQGQRHLIGRTYHFRGSDSPQKLALFVESHGAIVVLTPGSVYQITAVAGTESMENNDRLGIDRAIGQLYRILPFPGD